MIMRRYLKMTRWGRGKKMKKTNEEILDFFGLKVGNEIKS